jgi:hypothetical protein
MSRNSSSRKRLAGPSYFGHTCSESQLDEHFRKYARHSEQAVEAFPLTHPVADAVVEDCQPWTDETFAINLTQARILTKPKPTFYGMLPVPWKAAPKKELSGRARSGTSARGQGEERSV